MIGENIRLIDSIINYINTEKIPGLLLFVDFEKAFDSIEWSFIEKTLKYYNFGTSLVTWVKVFYTDINSCVLNNGWSSDCFNLGRGVRQECPLPPYLFILCTEIHVLGNTVRKDNRFNAFIDKYSIKTNYLEYHKKDISCSTFMIGCRVYFLVPNSKGSS